MQDKEKLKKLLDILEELLKIKGNEWLIDAILEKIKQVSSIEEIAKHSVIQDIHEHCIEKVIIKQANDFYADFKITKIKQELIGDFIKMEHERRRDDFENFSLCVYQQIENITNYLFEQNIYKNWDAEKDKVAIQYFDRRKNQQIRKTVKELIFGNAKDWYINVKFKSLLYFYYFNKNIKVQIPFNFLVDTFNEVYQIRNLNHRGSSPTDYQKRTLDKIKGKESKYYFKFYGFLEDFIRNINKNISIIPEKQSSTNIKKNLSNTIGTNNPALQEVLSKMKKENK
ncbi:MAG: hypothetical protein DRJ10_01340 [Bacteroidetes bacterium]|nr:MAG: hypothetical protein DRJ10_01340 [Bacteroidota bacterium]